jgi:hypothetical protein
MVGAEALDKEEKKAEAGTSPHKRNKIMKPKGKVSFSKS